MKQKRRFQMKRVTFSILLCVLVMLVIGINAQADVIEGYIDYGGAKTWYQIVGAEKEGIPLILIHGGPAASHFYLEPLGALGNERPVIFYDQQGCGYSDPLEDPANWSVEYFVEELNALIQQLGLERYHLLGQSFGTMVAAEFALNHPDGLVGMIFAGPCLSIPRFIEDAEVLITTLPEDMQEAIYWAIDHNDFSTPEFDEATMEYYYRYVCRLDPWPEPLLKTMEYLNEDIYHYMWGPAEFIVTGTLQNYDLSPELHKIEYPTLFTCGKYDECTPKTTKYLQSLVPNSELKIFKKSAHEVHLEQIQQYNRTVRKFLKKVEKKEEK